MNPKCAKCGTSYTNQDNWIQSPLTGRLMCDMCVLVLKNKIKDSLTPEKGEVTAQEDL